MMKEMEVDMQKNTCVVEVMKASTKRKWETKMRQYHERNRKTTTTKQKNRIRKKERCLC